MTVKITKPALNLREELADLRKPSGIAGEAVLRADSVQEQRDLIGAGRRNLLINGRGFIDQRGLSGVGLNTSDYGLDRWYAGAGGITFTQLTGGGFKVARTASSSWTRIGQKIEDCYNTIGTKPFTVSFDIKWNVHSGNENSMVYFRWLQADGTETGTSSSADIDKVGVDGWEKFSATLTMPNDATNPKHLMMLIYGSRGTAAPWEFELDNVQLELGSVATEFEHRSYGEELALCQRYFQNVYNGQCFGSANTTTRMRINAPLSPEMRTNPAVARVASTISFQGMGVGVTSTDTAIAQASLSGTRYLGMDLGGFSGLTGRSYAGSHSRTLVFTADAEL